MPEHIRQGRSGGQNVATALKAKLMAEIKPDVQLLVFVYLNRVGLIDAMMSNDLIGRRADFDDFITGFNQASPLFHLVDVGPGKEAADAKIRGEYAYHVIYAASFRTGSDLCNYFARAPQTRRIFFAGMLAASFLTR